jgi:hypothetical protein
VTICPCCGFKFVGNLSEGCAECGARPVGEALPRPEHELPAYGRSLLLAVTGSLMVLVFLIQTIIALVQRGPSATPKLALASVLSFDLSTWLAAGETAAWRLKWVAMPVTIIVLWGSRKIYRSMLKSPARFCGVGYAKGGLVASAMVPLLIAILIGITVPKRLRQRQEAIQAGFYAQGYRVDRALLEYRAKFGTLPTDLEVLRQRLPDPDGSLAEALNNLNPAAYKTSTDLAALPKQKSPTLRGLVIRNASLDTATDDAPTEALSFTNYELPLPGADKLMGTEDDLIVIDGVIMKASESARRPGMTPVSGTTIKP